MTSKHDKIWLTAVSVLILAIAIVLTTWALHECGKGRRHQLDIMWIDVPSSFELSRAGELCADRGGDGLTVLVCPVVSGMARYCRVRCDR